jgi:hypothetical protein
VRPLQKNTIQYEKVRQNARQFKALTSISIEQFDLLLPRFEFKWLDFIERYNLDGTPRMRKYVPKNEEQLTTVADKLFFILYYKKNNSLKESLTVFFDLDVSMSNKWIHILTPILEKSLENDAPKRRIEEVEFKKDEKYIIDGSERPIQRDTYIQGKYYRGMLNPGKRAHLWAFLFSVLRILHHPTHTNLFTIHNLNKINTRLQIAICFKNQQFIFINFYFKR